MSNFYREACPTVKNILLLDSEGKHVALKYYSDDWPTNSAKVAFEKSVFTKLRRQMLDPKIQEEFPRRTAIEILAVSNVEKMEALENLDLILLCLDEIVDGG